MRIIVVILAFINFKALAFLPTQQEHIEEKIRVATLSIEVWKRPINKKTGRRNIFDKEIFVSKGVGVHLGDGYILTAYHIVESVAKREEYTYIKIYTKSGNPVKELSLSKCNPDVKDLRIDVCLLKGKFLSEGEVSLPKDYNFEPNKKQVFGLINQVEELGKLGKVITGNFLKEVDLSKAKVKLKEIKNITLYQTDIPTRPGNSGSVVFDTKTGRILGLTTSREKTTRKYDDGTVKVFHKAEVIPSSTIRKFLRIPGWKSKRLESWQTEFLN